MLSPGQALMVQINLRQVEGPCSLWMALMTKVREASFGRDALHTFWNGLHSRRETKCQPQRSSIVPHDAHTQHPHLFLSLPSAPTGPTSPTQSTPNLRVSAATLALRQRKGGTPQQQAPNTPAHPGVTVLRSSVSLITHVHVHMHKNPIGVLPCSHFTPEG